MKRRTIKRRKLWTVDRLYQTHRPAGLVFNALIELAAGKKIATPTRAMLCSLTGINRLPTISKALATLKAAGWIEKECIPVVEGVKTVARVLRVIIKKPYKTADILGVKNTRCSTVKRNKAKNKAFLEGNEHLVYLDSLTERGGGHTTPTTSNEVASSVAPQDWMADDRARKQRGIERMAAEQTAGTSNGGKTAGIDMPPDAYGHGHTLEPVDVDALSAVAENIIGLNDSPIGEKVEVSDGSKTNR